MAITRRTFLCNGTLAAVSAAAVPAFLSGAAVADAAAPAGKKRLVVIFQRGGADGLNLVIPHSDPLYYRLRPAIHIPQTEVIDLDGQFGLHPSLAAFKPLWDAKQLAIVHAAGSPHPTRLHFEAQDYMESGARHKATRHGWLNTVAGTQGRLRVSPSRAVEPGPRLPHNPGEHFAGSLHEISQLFKADKGIRVAFADIEGWDHHANEGATDGQLAKIARAFSEGIVAFWQDLGDLAKDTALVTMSEFGRAARENSRQGTDHGHGNVMFLLGGRVKGGKVYGQWPGLDDRHLHEGHNLAVTTDFRSVLAELVERHLGISRTATIFPGFGSQQRLGFL